MERLKTLLIIGLCCLIHVSNAQQTKFSALSNTDTAWVDKIFNDLIDNDTFNMVSVGIIKDGKIVYLKGYGDDIINGEMVQASACTNYRIGSISKIITATIAMKLMEEGKLNINKKVTEYISGFPEKGITIKHLLSHSSGISADGKTSESYFANNDFFNPVDAIDLFKDDILVSTNYPTYDDTLGHYSNHGYNLLGAVLEKVGEAPFSQLVYEKITKPLKLPFLGPEFKWEEPYYVNKYDANSISSQNGRYLHHLPSGGFKASVIDLTLLAQAYINENIFEDPNTFQIMSQKRSTILNAGSMNYGYGIERKPISNLTTVGLGPVGGLVPIPTFAFGHGGNIDGGGGSMYFTVKNQADNISNKKNGVVIICNKNENAIEKTVEILEKVPAMMVISNSEFKPKYPIVSNDANFDNNSSFYGKKIVLNNNYSPFFDTLNLVGNEVELNNGFEITSDTGFEIRLTNQNQDCPDNDGPIIIFPSIASSKNSLTKETNTSSSLQIFPNPASESLTIKIAKPQGASIEIYNIYGQKVHTIKSLTHLYELDVRDKESGLYIINLINNNEIIEHIKFIKK